MPHILHRHNIIDIYLYYTCIDIEDCNTKLCKLKTNVNVLTLLCNNYIGIFFVYVLYY